MTEEPPHLVHLAGPDVIYGERFMRQRCQWCGALLVDYDLASIAVPEGDDRVPPTWEIGSWVGVAESEDGVRVASWSEPKRYGNKVPDHSCMLLPVEETR